MKLEEYLSKRLGVPRGTSRDILEAIKEYTSYSLAKADKAHIPGVGTITRILKIKNSSYSFRISKVVQRLVPTYDVKDVEENLTKNKPSLALTQNIKLKLSNFRVNKEDLENIELEANIEAHPLKYHFLLYLQREFPYYLPYRHPTTNKEYHWTDIDYSINISRTAYPKGYAALYVLWRGIKNRNELMKEYNITKDSFWSILHKELDFVMLMLIYPEVKQP